MIWRTLADFEISLTHDAIFFSYYRYGEVVVVIGFNPSKKYAVSPEKRKELLNRMLKLCPASKHVRVEGRSRLVFVPFGDARVS